MISAIILAGGDGERFGSHVPKPFMSLNGRPVIQWSLDVIEPLVDEVIVVSTGPYKNYRWAPAGPTRSASVRSGLEATHGDIILVHDGVRPFITRHLVQQVLAAAERHPIVDTAVPVIDGYLEDGIPLPRAGRMLSQTPEAFHRDVLEDAFTEAAGLDFQDEISMTWWAFHAAPHVIEGIPLNTKITYPDDLHNAEAVLRTWCEPLTAVPDPLPRTLVLGGTGGIGSAIAEQIPDRTVLGSEDIDLNRPFRLDLGGYQAVIHAAGSTRSDLWGVNYHSVVELARKAVDQGWAGNLIVFSSTAATRGRPGFAAYSATKAALNTWLEATHQELAADGIYLNAIAPAKVDTPLQHRLNPNANPAEMLTPRYVADRTLPYLATDVHGHIVYLRYGLDT